MGVVVIVAYVGLLFAVGCTTVGMF